LCLAKPGERYVIYLRQGGTASLQLSSGEYSVDRFNPRTGETRQFGSVPGGVSWTTPAVPDTENWVWFLARRE
ncbi:MAG: hypothetical protein JNK85_18590, partial [Verrucomicrobiales bacterium]|nr:hypothetical protein [Verrucomicrobiales bacterium]